MKCLLIIILLVSINYCQLFSNRNDMSDWNLIVDAPYSQDCINSFAGLSLDYCCFDSQVQIQSKRIDQANILIFSAESGTGTQYGCMKLSKSLFGYTNNQPRDPQISFQWGEYSQIIQRQQILVSETTYVEDGMTKIKYVFQIPANIINNSSDLRILQTLEFIEVISNQPSYEQQQQQDLQNQDSLLQQQ